MSIIVSSDDVRSQNRHRVLKAVRRAKIASRTDVATATGLSAATVSAITSDLLAEGVLVKPPQEKVSADAMSGRGRPQVSLSVNPDASLVCAVYFQLNFISAALVDYSGAQIGVARVELDAETINSNTIRLELIECIELVLAQCGIPSRKMDRISVGFQGVTDAEGTRVLWTPICDDENIPIKAWLENHYGVPANVDNDCVMIAAALNWSESKTLGENFAAVLLAHGVGMGLVLNGQTFNGTRSSGGEFGHMSYIPDGALCRCGNRGCIEAYAGDYAISRGALGGKDDVTPAHVLEHQDLDAVLKAAENGDEGALQTIDKAGQAIGTGLASLFALIDSIPVVLVGPGALLFKYMERSLRDALSQSPGNNRYDVPITCVDDELPLVREGCSINALLLQDAELAMRRNNMVAAE